MIGMAGDVSIKQPFTARLFSPHFSRTLRRSLTNSINVDAVWCCSCRGMTRPGNANLQIGGLKDAIQENGVPGPRRAPTAEAWSISFMNRHAPNLGCAPVACENGGLTLVSDAAGSANRFWKPPEKSRAILLDFACIKGPQGWRTIKFEALADHEALRV